MKKKILVIALSIACCVGTLTATVLQPEGNTRYDLAVHKLATDSRPEVRAHALAELERAIEEGDARAAIRLGDIALSSARTEGDAAYQRALDYYQRAKDLGAPGADAAYAVALASRGYYAGRDTQEGRALLAQALPLLEQAAATRDKNVLWHLGILQVSGMAGPADAGAGHINITAAADAGHGQAALFVANRFRSMVPVQPEGELQYLKVAARAGIKQAQQRLDEFEARWSAAPPAAPAMGSLDQQPVVTTASMSLPATGAAATTVPREPASLEQLNLQTKLEATTRELEAVRARLAEAERRAGKVTVDDLIALNSAGLKAVLEGDYETAVLKFREAAKHDYAPALANLGLMYLNGTGVTVDGRQAVALFARAAKQGNVTAAENIARAYDFGLGVHKDRSRAITWYENAERMGSSIAAHALVRLKTQ